jgi:glyoxylase-like metal-dependent hydrolase (beta-lactamase superfamily II)
VNTHYHFDHTEGNVEYGGARIFAGAAAPRLMLERDADYWTKHKEYLPQPGNVVDDRETFRVGGQDVLVVHPVTAHTSTDLYVYVDRGGQQIVATGDLVFHGYYPFFDVSSGGSDVPGLIGTIRLLAGRYPKAVFVPGHGPLATAADLYDYADFLESLNNAVSRARAGGTSEPQAVKQIDLDRWHLSVLPIFHYGTTWSTGSNDVRQVYELQSQASNGTNGSGQPH